MECSPKPAQGLNVKNYPQQKSYVTIRIYFEKKGSERTAFSVFMRGLRLRRALPDRKPIGMGLYGLESVQVNRHGHRKVLKPDPCWFR
jgi:hypothetical protein